MTLYTRVEIVVGEKYIGQVIVENPREADALWSRWCNLRYKKHEDLGCAAFGHINWPAYLKNFMKDKSCSQKT